MVTKNIAGRSNTSNVIDCGGIELRDGGAVRDIWGGQAPMVQKGTVNLNNASGVGTGIVLAPDSLILEMKMYISTAVVGTHTITIGTENDTDRFTTTVTLTSQNDVIDLLESTSGKVAALLDTGATTTGGGVEIFTDINAADSTGRATLVVSYII